MCVAEIEYQDVTRSAEPRWPPRHPGRIRHTLADSTSRNGPSGEFRNVIVAGRRTWVMRFLLPVTRTGYGWNADSNRWQNLLTIPVTHAFTAAAGSNNVLDNVVAVAGNSSATAETAPTSGATVSPARNQAWTVQRAGRCCPRGTPVQPAIPSHVQPQATPVPPVAVKFITVPGLPDPYGTQVPLAFSGSCTAQANASVNSNGSIGTVTVTAGNTNCPGRAATSINIRRRRMSSAGDLVGGQNMTFFAGNLLKSNSGLCIAGTTQAANNRHLKLKAKLAKPSGGGIHWGAVCWHSWAQRAARSRSIPEGRLQRQSPEPA